MYEHSETKIRILRKKVEDLTEQLEQEKEIRESREDVISMIAGYLKVEVEPHQSFLERLIEAGDELTARNEQLERVVEKMTRTMNEAKSEQCWDRMPAGIHGKIDIIFKALSQLNKQGEG